MILAALLLAGAAADTEPELDCTRDNLAQQEMNICAAWDFEAADKALNAQWKITAEIMKGMDEDGGEDFYGAGGPGFRKTLLDAQRAWIKYRDAHCVTEGYIFRGGSMEPFMVSTCMARLTRERIVALEDLVPGGE